MKKDKKTYTILYSNALPTKKQKEKMLDHILSESRKYEASYFKYKASPTERFLRLITVYPWRFAFGLSTVQAVLCTMIWGTEYTNMVLKILGG